MNKDELVDMLLSIDEEASLTIGATTTKSNVVIVGGAAFLLHDLTKRKATHDVDILQADTVIRGIIGQYANANGAVSAYMDHLPYQFEDRLMPIDLETKAIQYLTPSIEDLVVMKLYAERPNDVQDIDSAAKYGGIDWALLDKLINDPDEARASALSMRRYDEMLGAYERFRERWQR